MLKKREYELIGGVRGNEDGKWRKNKDDFFLFLFPSLLRIVGTGNRKKKS